MLGKLLECYLTMFGIHVLGSKATTEKSSYLFLKKEIAVRLSNIIKEILYLPPKLLQMPSVELVRSWLVFSLFHRVNKVF